MAGHAAAFGQHTLGGVHAANVLGRGFAAHQNTGFFARGTCLRGTGGKDDAAGGGTGAGGDAAGDDVTRGFWVDLRVQQFGQRVGVDAQHRLFAGNDLVLGQRHGNAHGGAAVALHPHGIQNPQMAVVDGELDLHFLAQLAATDLGVIFQLDKAVGAEILQRRAARIAGQIDRALRLGQRIAALTLAKVTTLDLWQPRRTIDELDHARARFRLPDPQRHFLYHQPQARAIERRTSASCTAVSCGNASSVSSE